MKKFLIHSCLFAAVLIAAGTGFEVMLHRIPNTYRFKKGLIETKGDEMKTIIIGSSVGIHGIDASELPEGTYNLAISAQWLHYNRLMLEKYIDRMPQLESVILAFCYQALWEEDNNDHAALAYHNLYMDIAPEVNRIQACSELLSGRSFAFRKWSKYYIRHKNTMSCDSLGVDRGNVTTEKELEEKLKDIPRRVKAHTTPADKATREQIQKNKRHMEQIAALCRQKGITLYVVLPPVHKEYYRLADKAQIKEMEELLEELESKWDNVRCHNYLAADGFEDTDFSDGNHLSSDIGAPKFTRILRHDLQLDNGAQPEPSAHRQEGTK